MKPTALIAAFSRSALGATEQARFAVPARDLDTDPNDAMLLRVDPLDPEAAELRADPPLASAGSGRPS